MSSTFVADTSDSHKSDNTVIIIVNSDGSLSVDQETLQSLLANQQNASVSVVRVGVGGIDGGAGKEGTKNAEEGEDDGSPQLDLTVEGIFPAAANASSHSDTESTRTASSLTAVSALAAAASVAQDVSVEGAANPGVSVGGGSSATPGGTSAASTGEGLDPFLEMDPEQLQRLETALQSEQAKQILGEGVTAMLDMLSSDEQTNITDTIRMDHCYTSLGPGSAPPNPSSQGPYSSGASGESHSGRRMHRVDASDDDDDEDEDEDESSDSGESYGEPSRSRGRGRGRGRARGRLGGRWAGSGIRGRGGRGSRGGSMRGARGSGAPIIPKPTPSPVVQKVITATTSAITNISPSLAAVSAASLVPPSNVGTNACLVPVLKQLDLNPTITRTETIGSVSSKEPVKVVMMPAVLDRKHGAQHTTVPQGIMIIPGKTINPGEVKPVITTQRVITSTVPVNIAPKVTPTIVAVPKSPKLAMGSSPTVTTVVMSTHGVQPKVEVVQQPKVCLTGIGDISGIRAVGDASKVKVEKLSSPEILSMQSGLESSREEDDGETTATTTDNTEDTEEDDIPDSGGIDDEREESVRSGRALHGGRRSWGGARVRGRGLRGFRLERESGMGVLVRGGRGGTRGRRRAGRPRSGGDGGRGRGGRGGKRIPEPEEDHSQVAADAVAMGVPTNTPKKPIIMMGRGGKKVIMQEKVHVEKLPQQDITVPVSAMEETLLPSPTPENAVVPHVEEKTENALNSLASGSLLDSHPSTPITSKVSGLGPQSEAMLSAARKLYPKRENRKPPAHLADAFGPALFSAPDVMRRVPDHSNPDAPGMVVENSETDEELRLVLSEDEEEKAMREVTLLKAKSSEVDVTPKPKEIVKEVDEPPKLIKMERVETSSVKVEEPPVAARGGRRRRTAAAAKRLAKKEEMEEAMASEDDEEDEEEEDDDASVNSEDDPNRLWCICKKPHNNRFMICCDICEDWFHGKCVGVTKAMGRQMEEKGQEWNCPNCTVKQQKEKEKEKKASSMVDEDWDPGKKKTGVGAAPNLPAGAAVAAAGTNGRRRKSAGAAVAPKAPSPPPQPVSTEKKKQLQPVQNQQHTPQQHKAEVSGVVVAGMVKESDSGAASEKKVTNVTSEQTDMEV